MSKLFSQEITKCMECYHFDEAKYKCKELKRAVRPMRIDSECKLADFVELLELNCEVEEGRLCRKCNKNISDTPEGYIFCNQCTDELNNNLKAIDEVK